VEEQFKTQILEYFDPVTLEYNQASPAAIQSQQQHKQRKPNSLEHRPGHEQAAKTGRRPCTRAEDWDWKKTWSEAQQRRNPWRTTTKEGAEAHTPEEISRREPGPWRDLLQEQHQSLQDEIWPTNQRTSNKIRMKIKTEQTDLCSKKKTCVGRSLRPGRAALCARHEASRKMPKSTAAVGSLPPDERHTRKQHTKVKTNGIGWKENQGNRKENLPGHSAARIGTPRQAAAMAKRQQTVRPDWITNSKTKIGVGKIQI
jgi:hypothetical protein